jgi:N-acetylmuramoyl-L-alanine amidase
MKKSVYTFLAAFFFLLLFPHLSHAEEAIPLFLNGKPIVSSVPAQNIKGTTMVPIRVISEKLGAVVGWNDKEKKVTITKNDLKIVMQMKNKGVTVNGKSSQLIEAPLNMKGTGLLPLRFLAENLGLKVTWNKEARSVLLSNIVIEKPVVISKPVEVTVPVLPKDPNPVEGTVEVPQTTHDQEEVGAEQPAVAAPITEVQTVQSVDEQIIVQANGDLHPKMFYLSSPERLVVDFEQTVLSNGLRFNTPAITSDENAIPDENVIPNLINPETPTDSSLPITNIVNNPIPNGFSVASSVYIDKIRYANFSDKPPTVRVVIDLKQKAGYQLIEDKVNHQVTIALVNRTTPYTIVLDAGHGGKDTGAISITKRREKDFNLAMVLKIQKLLQNEPLIQLVMTRQDDTFVELDDRAAIANNLGATLFVSVHGNSYMKASNGVETYYYNQQSLTLAQTMHPYIVESTGFADKKVKKEKFRVVSATEMPAILLELGYLSNPTEEAEMYKEDFQNRVAEAVVKGIKDYLHIQ